MKRLVTALLLSGFACGETPEEVPEEEASVALPGDDVVLAEVNGSTITRYDLERTVAETLDEFAVGRLEPEARRQALESLVSTRAIAQARERELSPEQRAEVDRKVSRYRDQILVGQYLAAHAPPSAVTDEMVREYYEEHADRFGGGTVRRHEVLYATRALADTERNRVLAELREADGQPDWRAFAASLRERQMPMAHQRGDSNAAGVLPTRVRRVLETLPAGRASAVTFVEGRPFVVRVTGETQRPRRPLAEVRREIRAALAPLQIRASVRQVRADVLAEAEVTYR